MVDDNKYGKVLECPEPTCGRKFHSCWSLTRHTRTHTGDKPFRCAVPGCGKDFVEKCALRRHEQTHNNEKHWTCDIPSCGKKFKLKEYLDVHKRTHLNKDSNECRPCGDPNSEFFKIDDSSEGTAVLLEQLQQRMMRFNNKQNEEMTHLQELNNHLKGYLRESGFAFNIALSLLESQSKDKNSVPSALLDMQVRINQVNRFFSGGNDSSESLFDINGNGNSNVSNGGGMPSRNGHYTRTPSGINSSSSSNKEMEQSYNDSSNHYQQQQPSLSQLIANATKLPAPSPQLTFPSPLLTSEMSNTMKDIFFKLPGNNNNTATSFNSNLSSIDNPLTMSLQSHILSLLPSFANNTTSIPSASSVNQTQTQNFLREQQQQQQQHRTSASLRPHSEYSVLQPIKRIRVEKDSTSSLSSSFLPISLKATAFASSDTSNTSSHGTTNNTTSTTPTTTNKLGTFHFPSYHNNFSTAQEEVQEEPFEDSTASSSGTGNMQTLALAASMFASSALENETM